MPPRRFRPSLALVALLVLPPALACRTSTGPGTERVAAPIEQVLHLEVAPARVPCVGVEPMQCLQVRRSATAPWEAFYDHIQGFTYEEGYRYRLRVGRRELTNPPADASSFEYRLRAVLERVRD
jgi:hypothetical protein